MVYRDRSSIDQRLWSRHRAIQCIDHFHRTGSGKGYCSILGNHHFIAGSVWLLRQRKMIFDTTFIKSYEVSIHSFAEIRKVLTTQWRPGNLRECQGTRIHHILHLGIGIHIFRPVVALHTQNMLIKSSLADYIRNRVETIGFGQIDRTAWNRDRFYLTVALIMVKVKTTRTRSHDNIMPLLSRFDTSINTSPRHDGSILTQSTFQNFIPSDDFLTILLQHLFYTFDHIAL